MNHRVDNDRSGTSMSSSAGHATKQSTVHQVGSLSLKPERENLKQSLCLSEEHEQAEHEQAEHEKEQRSALGTELPQQATAVGLVRHPQNNPNNSNNMFQNITSTEIVHTGNNNNGMGWRVKLYRLNNDGSWDDCGTGRISCQYSASLITSNMASDRCKDGKTSSEGPLLSHQQRLQDSCAVAIPEQLDSPSPLPETLSEEYLYGKLSNPVLCMFAESSSSKAISNARDTLDDNAINVEITNKTSADSQESTLLLHTRILLRDTYQRQGENIITWCEPTLSLDGSPLLARVPEICTIKPMHGSTNQAAGGPTTGTGGGHAHHHHHYYHHHNHVGRLTMVAGSAAAGQQHQQQNINVLQQQDQQQKKLSNAASGNHCATGVDLALSFQDNAGCLDIWSQITAVQQKALEWIQRHHTEAMQQQHRQMQGGQQQRKRKGVCTGVVTNTNNNFNILHRVNAVGNSTPVGSGLGVDRHSAELMNEQGLCNSSQDSGRATTSLKYTHNNNVPGVPVVPGVAALRHGGGGSGFRKRPPSPQHLTSEDRPENSSAAINAHVAASASGSGFYRAGSPDVTSADPAKDSNNARSSAAGLAKADANNTNAAQAAKAFETHSAIALTANASSTTPGSNLMQTLQLSFYHLPTPPTRENLEELADIIHATVTCQSFIPFQQQQQQETPIEVQSLDQGSNPATNKAHTSDSIEASKNNYTGNNSISLPIAKRQLQPLSREDLGTALTANNNEYFLKLLDLFPELELLNDLASLCTLASITKSILFLNEPALLESVVEDPLLFEKVCGVMEFDPELRVKALHRHFLHKELKFRTVVFIRDAQLIDGIQKCWRVQYLKDTLLRPTMEEGSLTTLASLLHFAHNDVVRGVTSCTTASAGPASTSSVEDGNDNSASSSLQQNKYEDCYLARILRMLGTELYCIRVLEQFQHQGEEVGNDSFSEQTPASRLVVMGSINSPQVLNGDTDSASEDSEDARSTRRTNSQMLFARPNNSFLTSTSSMVDSHLSHLKTPPITPAPSPSESPAHSPSQSTSSGPTQTFLAHTSNQAEGTLGTKKPQNTSIASPSAWKQHLLPQDSTISSRRLRRKGCLEFLRELFNMVRTSLQQSAKDDFYAMICLMDVTVHIHVGQKGGPASRVVNLLQLLGSVMSDSRGTSQEEKSAALEIISGVTCHDPSLIRRHILDEPCKRPRRPEPVVLPSIGKCVIFPTSEDDLLLALCTIMAIEKDAGLLLQALEIIRIILDTDMHVMEHDEEDGSEFEHFDNMMYEEVHDDVDDAVVAGATLGASIGTANPNLKMPQTVIHATGSVSTENEDKTRDKSGQESIKTSPGSLKIHSPTDKNGSLKDTSTSIKPSQGSSSVSAGATITANNPFLSIFYEHYIYWLVAPFQYSICITAVNLADHTALIASKHFPKHAPIVPVPKCAVRASFALELLCFCVRAHCYRMKNYVLRSRVISHIVKLLQNGYNSSGDTCLKLSALRFLRSVISVKDEYYHRYIVQHDVFSYVFEAFRKHPIGDNLVSSSIIEMCDFIRTENQRTLLEYIVTKYILNRNVSALKPGIQGEGSPMQRPGFSAMNYSRQSSKSNSIVNSNVSGLNSRHKLQRLSLEDLATPHVDTFTLMRQKYEENLHKSAIAISSASGQILRLSDRDSQSSCSDDNDDGAGLSNLRYRNFSNGSSNGPGNASHVLRTGSSPAPVEYDMDGNSFSASQDDTKGMRDPLNPKGLADQRKFREMDEEDSYFNEDDDEVDERVSLGPRSTNLAEGASGVGDESMIMGSSARHFMPLDHMSTTASAKGDDKGNRHRTNVHNAGDSSVVLQSLITTHYASSSDDEEDAESNSSADDTDSSTSSIITNASSTSDVAKEEIEEPRTVKRARVMYGFGDDEEYVSNLSAPSSTLSVGLATIRSESGVQFSSDHDHPARH